MKAQSWRAAEFTDNDDEHFSLETFAVDVFNQGRLRLVHIGQPDPHELAEVPLATGVAVVIVPVGEFLPGLRGVEGGDAIPGVPVARPGEGSRGVASCLRRLQHAENLGTHDLGRLNAVLFSHSGDVSLRNTPFFRTPSHNRSDFREQTGSPYPRLHQNNPACLILGQAPHGPGYQS